MARDPAFLFYDGDASRDVSHMNRLERGCYFDLIQAQRKFGGFTVEQARKILGKDFDECWPSLELILSKQDDKYYIEWLMEATIKRQEYTEKQRKRIQDYWDKKKTQEIPRNNRGVSVEIPIEKEKEEEEEENENIKEEFEKFWNLYPRRNGKRLGKKLCLDWWKKNANGNVYNLMTAVRNYADSQTTKDGYAKDPIRFLKADWWRDWIEPPEKEMSAIQKTVLSAVSKYGNLKDD